MRKSGSSRHAAIRSDRYGHEKKGQQQRELDEAAKKRRKVERESRRLKAAPEEVPLADVDIADRETSDQLEPVMVGPDDLVTPPPPRQAVSTSKRRKS